MLSLGQVLNYHHTTKTSSTTLSSCTTSTTSSTTTPSTTTPSTTTVSSSTSKTSSTVPSTTTPPSSTTRASIPPSKQKLKRNDENEENAETEKVDSDPDSEQMNLKYQAIAKKLSEQYGSRRKAFQKRCQKRSGSC